jgi:hypothetical protein
LEQELNSHAHEMKRSHQNCILNCTDNEYDCNDEVEWHHKVDLRRLMYFVLDVMNEVHDGKYVE